MTIEPDNHRERESSFSAPPVILKECCVRTAGERLAYLRRQAGMELHDITSITAISKSELSRLENNTRPISKIHKTLLAKAYGIDTDYLDEILNHNPAPDSFLKSSSPSGDYLFRPSRQMPCYHSGSFRDGSAPAEMITLAMAIPLSEQGYAIMLDEPLASFLPENALILVDPQTRCVLGDLVANIVGKEGLLLTLERTETGILTGTFNTFSTSFPLQTKVSDFHKVVAIFPAMHLVCLNL